MSDLQNYCRDSRESAQVTPTSGSPVTNLFHCMVDLSRYITANQSASVTQTSSVLPQGPRSVWGSHPGYHLTSSRHVPSGSSQLWRFLRLALFSMSTGQVFCKMSLDRNLSDVFTHDQTRVKSLGKEDHREKVPFSSHQGCNTSHTTDHCRRWPWSPGWDVFVRLLHCEVTGGFFVCFFFTSFL